MNRYSWLILVFASMAMAIYSTATVVMFSRGISQQRILSETRMTALASYCARQIMREMPNSGDIGTWLSDMCQTTGFERIVIADSSGIVFHSSQEIIRRGEDIWPYLIDSSLFSMSVEAGTPLFTRPVKIDKTYFRSLYYPFSVQKKEFAVIIEADEHYFQSAQKFRSSVLLSMFLFALITGLLAALIAVVDRRAGRSVKLAQKNEELAFLGRTSAELAHEIKNPLAIIKSSVDVLQRRYDIEKKEKPFAFISGEILRLSRMVDDILSFSREKKTVSEPFNPWETVNEAFVSFTSECPEVIFHNDINREMVINGDRDAFLRISSNLFRNSITAMNGRGEIRVSDKTINKRICFDFLDNGPGIPDNLSKRLFEPFVSGSKTGTGLGLAIIRTLCDACRWEISLVSHNNGNTCFRVCI